MSSSILLSICIPTYNRANYLDETIASIVNQIDDNTKDYVEICISDNASTDNTKDIIKLWIDKSPINITLHVNECNDGADINFLKAIDIAKGEYCWLLSSDDRIEDGGIGRVIKKIQHNLDTDLFVLCQIGYSKDFSSPVIIRGHSLLKAKSDLLFSKVQDCIDSVSYTLGYISILVFRKKSWDRIEGFEKYIGSAYVHYYKILSMIRDGAQTMFLRQENIGWRSDNDSFLSELKSFNRIKLDVEGYYRIAADVFGEYSYEHNSIVRQIINIYGVEHVIALKMRNENITMQYKVLNLCYHYYKRHPNFWIKIVPLLCTPNWVYHLARFIYRRTLKPYRLQQNNALTK